MKDVNMKKQKLLNYHNVVKLNIERTVDYNFKEY